MALSWEAPAGDDRDPPEGQNQSPRFLGSALRFAGQSATGLPARFFLVMILIGSAVATVASVGRSDMLREAVEPLTIAAVPPPTIPLPPQSSAPVSVLPVLSTSLRFTPERLGVDAPFIRTARIDPAKVCAAIGQGQGEMVWAKSPVSAGEWECISDVPSGRKKTAGPLLFAMARGVDETQINYVRFKLTAEEAASLDEGAKALDAEIGRLFDVLGWPMAERVPLSTRMLVPFTLDDGGANIRLSKEVSREGRYNLIVTFRKNSVGLELGDRTPLLSPLDPLKSY